ncbi:hypothetical protein ACQ4PT_000172 [Festuca glaucescens]
MEALLGTLQEGGWGAVAAAAATVVVLAAIIGVRIWQKERANTPPVVPGLPLIGNLYQLKEKKPHKTFAKWSEIYGPIYAIRIGDSCVVVVNSTEVAKEAMVAKFSSISNRKLPQAFSRLSHDKMILAVCDNGDYYKMVKHFVMAGMLGSSAQDRLYQEIQEVCGEDTVSEDHLPQLPYLNAVFHETLRLHSPVSLLPARLVHETTTLAGYQVQAGTLVVINVYGCNMSKKEWDEPEEWRPERFLDGRFELADMYKTMSFGAGKRICAGTAQVTKISCTAIARFVQEFSWRLGEGDEDKVDAVHLMGYKLLPLYAYLSQRRKLAMN